MIDRLALCRVVNQAYGTTTIRPDELDELPWDDLEVAIQVTAYNPARPPQE